MQIVLTAVIGGVVTFLFGVITKKLVKMDKKAEERHEEHKKVSIKERELLLAIADTTKLTAKKVNDSSSVNGELEESVEYLQKKKHEVQDLTREIAFERLEH